MANSYARVCAHRSPIRRHPKEGNPCEPEGLSLLSSSSNGDGPHLRAAGCVRAHCRASLIASTTLSYLIAPSPSCPCLRRHCSGLARSKLPQQIRQMAQRPLRVSSRCCLDTEPLVSRFRPAAELHVFPASLVVHHPRRVKRRLLKWLGPATTLSNSSLVRTGSNTLMRTGVSGGLLGLPGPP